ncbi:L-carnitine dehydrogenase [Fusarium oxysporum f. sp. albedinis]|nr:L-carnitine dehydrogenase [Fusarium oxysporum f. sp. albedinis]
MDDSSSPRAPSLSSHLEKCPLLSGIQAQSFQDAWIMSLDFGLLKRQDEVSWPTTSDRYLMGPEPLKVKIPLRYPSMLRNRAENGDQGLS